MTTTPVRTSRSSTGAGMTLSMTFGKSACMFPYEPAPWSCSHDVELSNISDMKELAPNLVVACTTRNSNLAAPRSWQESTDELEEDRSLEDWLGDEAPPSIRVPPL